jgi:polysaccharide biosynthesis protein PslG
LHSTAFWPFADPVAVHYNAAHDMRFWMVAAMKRTDRVAWGPRLVLATLMMLGLVLLVTGCGEQDTPTATPKPMVTLRPTFTPTAGSSLTPEAETPEPETATLAVQATETPNGEVSPVAETTQTPLVITATPPAAAPSKTPTPRPATATPGQQVRMESPGYGMQAFLWWRAEVAQRDLEAIRDAGFGWVKQAFAWRDIEGKGKGQYDWTVTDRIVDQVQSVGSLKLIVRLDSEPTWASGQSYPNAQEILMTPPQSLQDYASFCGAVATRYKGRIGAYQVWNEPNLAREWGGQAPSSTGYAALLKVCYQAIKQADPSAIVISAGMAPTTQDNSAAMPDTKFLQQMYAAGAKPYFDALGAHGAGYKAPPEKDPGEVATDASYYNAGDPNCPGSACRVYCFRHVEDLHEVMVDNGDTGKQVVVLEFGWTMDPRANSPYHWHAVTEQQQAAYLVGAYQYAKQNWQPWIGIMSLIYMPNIDWTQDDEQYWWSIAIPNYPQLYSYQSYRDLKAMPK